jgi:hypothetical protein
VAKAIKPTSVGIITRILASVLGDNDASLRVSLLALMPNARLERRGQAPQPRSGAPKAQGLIVAFQPQHNPSCRRSLLPPQ